MSALPAAAQEAATTTCGAPSRNRYKRYGCRCDSCVQINSEFKKQRRREKALEAGRVFGEKPCVRCGEPINVLGSSNAKKFCEPCAADSLKESRAAGRARRRDQQVAYMREYYQRNRDRWRLRRELHRDRIYEQNRLGRMRNISARRAQERERYIKKNPPTIHERALEMFHFRSSDGGPRAGGKGTGRGFFVHKCKCGCGLPINAAHIAVARLLRLGYSRKEIAARLGVHPSEVSQLKLDGERRSWAWYRRGHSNLKTAKRQPINTRRRLSRSIELRLLVEQQDTESSFGARAKTSTGRSLDAVIAGTEGLALIDTVAAPESSGDYTDTEESFFDWLHRNGVDLDGLAGRCADDPNLAAALAESMETGYPTREALALLGPDRRAA